MKASDTTKEKEQNLYRVHKFAEFRIAQKVRAADAQEAITKATKLIEEGTYGEVERSELPGEFSIVDKYDDVTEEWELDNLIVEDAPPSVMEWDATVRRKLVQETILPDGSEVLIYYEREGVRAVRVLQDVMISNCLEPWVGGFVFETNHETLRPYRQPYRTLKEWKPGTLIGYRKELKNNTVDYVVLVHEIHKDYFKGVLVGEVSRDTHKRLNIEQSGIPVKVRFQNCFMWSSGLRMCYAQQDSDGGYRINI